MTRADFLNRLRSLHFIDRDQLPELDMDDWCSFRNNPPLHFMSCDDTQAAAIWREVERRQAPVERFAVVRKIEAAGGAEYAPAHEGPFAATRDDAERECRENAGYVVARVVIEEAGKS